MNTNSPYDVVMTHRIAWVLIEHKEFQEGTWMEKADWDAGSDEFRADYAVEKEVTGYGVRWTMPGFMDCGEWSVFETLDGAQAEYDELVEVFFPKDEEEEDEE